jgi:hypothetical protein
MGHESEQCYLVRLSEPLLPYHLTVALLVGCPFPVLTVVADRDSPLLPTVRSTQAHRAVHCAR